MKQKHLVDRHADKTSLCGDVVLEEAPALVLTHELVVKARIEHALDAIEEAQNKLDEACRAVSSIIGFAPECRTIGNMSRTVKDLWYKIDAANEKKKSKLKLDREPDEKWDAKYFK